MPERNEDVGCLNSKDRVNKISKIVAVIFVIAGLILFWGKRDWFPSFYHHKFMAIAAFISAFLIISPRLIFNAVDSGQQKNLNLLQASIVVGLSLNGLGALGLFRAGFGYDKFLHFFIPFLFTIVSADFYRQQHRLSFKKSIILAMILIFLAGLLWEFFEFLGDYFFNTKMMGYGGEFVIKDTVLDLMANFFGIISGALILILFEKKTLSN